MFIFMFFLGSIIHFIKAFFLTLTLLNGFVFHLMPHSSSGPDGGRRCSSGKVIIFILIIHVSPRFHRERRRSPENLLLLLLGSGGGGRGFVGPAIFLLLLPQTVQRRKHIGVV
uniref:High mobility group nucleosome-binding domain-containing protein 5-like n=1 Tax=Rhizophora mucronata TaxID=61149 RepID=A0A2P2LWX2_RHIMU